MSNGNPGPRTEHVRALVQRIQAGDRAAEEELVRACAGRLQALTAKMLRGFPGVLRWERPSDVLQMALLRLLPALKEVECPESTRRFYGPAALQIRRALLDLARHYQGPEGLGANHKSWPRGEKGEAGGPNGPDDCDDVADFERWRAFHEAVENLPDEEREVVGLIFYGGLTKEEAAELTGTSSRTVYRQWNTALLKLSAELRR
jgi:RNA polymerase sigma-70 factor (ECF subfamily)